MFLGDELRYGMAPVYFISCLARTSIQREFNGLQPFETRIVGNFYEIASQMGRRGNGFTGEKCGFMQPRDWRRLGTRYMTRSSRSDDVHDMP